MPAQDNKEIARRFREEIWSSGNVAVADQICTGDAVFHFNDPLTPDFGRGPTALRQMVTMYRTAFPDIRVAIDDIIAEGDRVVIRWNARGTQKGKLGGIPPSGKPITVTGIDILRIAGGRIQEGWVNWDAMGLVQQIGVLQKGSTQTTV